jgi:signal transduction histidine kinase
MYRTALAVSHTLDIDQLLESILQMIFEWVEADRGCVMLINEETGELEPAARRDRKKNVQRDSMAISRTILDYVMQREEGVLTSNARDDKRWNSEGSILTLGVREAICVPLQGRYGVVGVIYIDTYTPPGRASSLQNPVNRFSQEHLKLMVAIGHQAALAVEDTSYYSAMVQAERLAAMGQTIATLSHHIKNILQGIRGGSYLIEEGLKSDQNEVVRRGWRIVEKNQERISSLVMDMLSFSKDREPELQEGDLTELAEDVVELMAARAQECGVRLTLQPDNDVPLICFDYEGMHRALLNVVGNAIDACEGAVGAEVVVSTGFDPVAGEARFQVLDNGQGIAPEDLKAIFSVFQSRKGSRGTGLGLPVSRKILSEHGGDVSVQSQLGAGSRFTLHWPAVLGGGSASQTIA